MTIKLTQDPEALKAAVRDKYTQAAQGGGCGCGYSCGCEGDDPRASAVALGYDPDELATLPESANLGLGCGAPVRDAEVQPGETVLDLGSGAGIDCFLAARQVGPTGRVIGVDMTDAMLEKARANAAREGIAHVEFRKGELEALPVDSGSVDLVVSNCVLSLVPDKARAYSEILRVLRPGGRFVISDVVSRGLIPEALRQDMEAYVGCTAGAMDEEEYLGLIRTAGFREVTTLRSTEYAYGASEAGAFFSVTVRGVK